MDVAVGSMLEDLKFSTTIAALTVVRGFGAIGVSLVGWLSAYPESRLRGQLMAFS